MPEPIVRFEGVTYQYPGTEHGFNCDDRPSVFNPTVATDAWQRTLAWFESQMRSNGFAEV